MTGETAIVADSICRTLVGCVFTWVLVEHQIQLKLPDFFRFTLNLVFVVQKKSFQLFNSHWILKQNFVCHLLVVLNLLLKELDNVIGVDMTFKAIILKLCHWFYLSHIDRRAWGRIVPLMIVKCLRIRLIIIISFCLNQPFASLFLWLICWIALFVLNLLLLYQRIAFYANVWRRGQFACLTVFHWAIFSFLL